MSEPVRAEKKLYERPVLTVYGSAAQLTNTGLAGATEGQGNSGQKKKNSLG